MLCYLSSWLYWISFSLPPNWAVIQTASQHRKNAGIQLFHLVLVIYYTGKFVQTLSKAP